MKLNFSTIFVIVFLFLIPNSVFAGDLLLGKEKAATVCSACHGMDGQSASGGNSPLIPNITAQQRDYLIVKLKDYKMPFVSKHQRTTSKDN